MSTLVGIRARTVTRRPLAAMLLAAAAALAFGCAPATGSAPSAAVRTPTPTAAASDAAVKVRPDPPATCPVTVPDPPLVPPDPFLPTPPASYQAAWHGMPDLWTMLDRRGEVWWALPHDAKGFSQKTFWWSDRFDVQDEPQPAISVSGRRLDGAGSSFAAGPPGTNATADFGSAMLVGVEVPVAGCWSIQAAYRDHTLEYVVWVAGD